MAYGSVNVPGKLTAEQVGALSKDGGTLTGTLSLGKGGGVVLETLYGGDIWFRIASGAVNFEGAAEADLVWLKGIAAPREANDAATKQYVDNLFKFCSLGPVAQVEVESNGSKRTANVAMTKNGSDGLCYRIEYKFNLTDAATVRIIPPAGFRFSALNESFIPSIKYKYGNTYAATLMPDGWFEFYVGMRDTGECEIYNASCAGGSLVLLEIA